jgi:hypothetical protein
MTFNKKTLNYRFPLWLTVIFFTLFSIPILVVYEYLTLAKIAGVVTVVLTTIAIRYWLIVARQKTGVIDKVPLTKNDLFDLKRLFPYFNHLSNSEITVYKDKIGLVLSRNRFLDDKGEHLSKLNSIQLAFFIVLIDLKNPISINNCLIIDSSSIISQSFNQDQTVIYYPLGQLLDEKSLFDLSFDELVKQHSIQKFEQTLRNPS